MLVTVPTSAFKDLGGATEPIPLICGLPSSVKVTKKGCQPVKINEEHLGGPRRPAALTV